MNIKPLTKAHWSFWLIGVIALLWNVGGCINFFMQMNPEIIAQYRESERAIIQGRPLWATIGFAIGVFGGAVGSLLLLLKKSISYTLFIVSLLGVIVTVIHTQGVDYDFSIGEIILMAAMPMAVAIVLIWYAGFSKSKKWLA